ncbi:unnamed protein product [Aphanomyces euteiches]
MDHAVSPHKALKRCAITNCQGNARSRNLCYRHGKRAQKPRCIVEGCMKFAHARHRCIAHGGARMCKYEGCPSQSRNGGFCQRHGGRKKGQIVKTRPVENAEGTSENMSDVMSDASNSELLPSSPVWLHTSVNAAVSDDELSDLDLMVLQTLMSSR